MAASSSWEPLRAAVLDTLKTTWGYHQPHVWQLHVLRALLADRRDAVVVQATGSGKSMVYQLPSLVLAATPPPYLSDAAAAAPLTIVISPLIALMADQTARLSSLGISSTFMGSGNPGSSAIRSGLISGDQDALALRIVYMSPEYASSMLTTSALAAAPAFASRIVLLAIDEAHCISKWGHDFRQAYLDLPGRVADVKAATGAPVVALTATATSRVVEELAQSMQLTNPLVSVGSFNRPNLHLSFGVIDSVDSQVVPLLTGKDSAARKPSIVYCRTRKATERIAAKLKSSRAGRVEAYHAGLGAQRKGIQDRFTAGQLDVVVCTIAFGMGIDKANIRSVIHAHAPSSIESYYQQIGRGGRDGDLCECYCFWLASDFEVDKNSDAAVYAQRLASASALKALVSTAKTCRKQSLVAYFGESILPCHACDICDLGDAPLIDFSCDAFLLLGALQVCGETAGPSKAIKLLHGTKPPGNLPVNFSTFLNAGSHHSPGWWSALGFRLIKVGMIVSTHIAVRGRSRGFDKWSLTREAKEYVAAGKPQIACDKLVFHPGPELLVDCSPKSSRPALQGLLQRAPSSSLIINSRSALRSALLSIEPSLSATVVDDIVDHVPASLSELTAINGISSRVVGNVGTALLAAVKPYVPLAKAFRAEAIASAKQSLALFQDRGLALQSVATARGKSVNTILRQLMLCVSNGDSFNGSLLGWSKASVELAYASFVSLLDAPVADDVLSGSMPSTPSAVDENIVNFIRAFVAFYAKAKPHAGMPDVTTVTAALLSSSGTLAAAAISPTKRVFDSSTELAIKSSKSTPAASIKPVRHSGNRLKRKRSFKAKPAAVSNATCVAATHVAPPPPTSASTFAPDVTTRTIVAAACSRVPAVSASASASTKPDY
ncbi:ATP-dependent DNA helicase RecQ [Thecamonas trahens ATCC 50062]|uniref:ATP-dependent DNA helicase n=1 Tax=Thecamonas trahens ATCC 50062 TaxID=461836 RepID=A0A0L0DIG2_THETB|nr:ATP-dependent DNA helicase RecQ [Thecamonas trahens ATCC 50062]KNC52154.1 ATP-dependent DNA helicase RecQ [Thecamonas trahens ATCC 50062]|eukprot:XP_013762157.1 ATP-dependent DNA helicase RecQ [Thecamonas trahens ATCC 50062]